MKYAIAAGHDATADTAEEILRSGGNAVDAAIAAFMTTFIAEPCMSSGGGGAFAMVRSASGDCKIYDFFCQTPQTKRPVEEVEFLPIEVDFGAAKETFHIGRGSVGVPGSIAGIFAMHKAYGTMPMKDLVQIPMEFAKEGVIINDFQSYDIELLESILGFTPHGKSLFFKNNKRIEFGDVLRMPRLADFLDYMSREGEAAFYKGEVAQKIMEQQAEFGFLTQADFDNYEVKVRTPLLFKYKQKNIYTNPLPSIGGALLAHYMNELGNLKLSEEPLNTGFVKNLYQVYSNNEKLNRRPESLSESLLSIYDANKKYGSTSHFNIVDQWGNAVSLTMTIGEGSGHFIEGTDIQLNNMLGEAALLPDGFHSWHADARLSSMMSPTMVTNDSNQLEIVMGTGGAGRIPGAIFQTLHYLIDYNFSARDAVNAPRTHLSDGIFDMEPGFDISFETHELTHELKKWKKQSLYFGGVHTIRIDGEKLDASGDDRRDGVFVLGD